MAAGILATTSCSSGPEPPKPGSPAFLWNAAKATYRSGDFVKTSETLQQLTRSDSEFASRARPWSIVISAGLAQGYAETAEAYEAGARANRANPTPFRKEVNQLRSRGSAAAVEFAETVHAFLAADKAPTCCWRSRIRPARRRSREDSEGVERRLDSGFGAGAAAHLDAAARRLAERRPRGGESGRPGQDARDLKERGSAGARPVFLLGVAKMLYDSSELFGPMKMDQPVRLRLLCQEATESLAGVPESKETKALTAKIQAALKKIKSTT